MLNYVQCQAKHAGTFTPSGKSLPGRKCWDMSSWRRMLNYAYCHTKHTGTCSLPGGVYSALNTAMQRLLGHVTPPVQSPSLSLYYYPSQLQTQTRQADILIVEHDFYRCVIPHSSSYITLWVLQYKRSDGKHSTSALHSLVCSTSLRTASGWDRIWRQCADREGNVPQIKCKPRLLPQCSPAPNRPWTGTCPGAGDPCLKVKLNCQKKRPFQPMELFALMWKYAQNICTLWHT